MTLGSKFIKHYDLYERSGRSSDLNFSFHLMSVYCSFYFFLKVKTDPASMERLEHRLHEEPLYLNYSKIILCLS